MRYENCELTTDEVIGKIIETNSAFRHQWSDAYGWAPSEAACLLAESRLDWIVSLSHTLRMWIGGEVSEEEHDGRLILAWANLGSLVEGSMKFLLSVYAQTYQDDVDVNRAHSIFKKLWDDQKGSPKEVDELTLDVLREFFRKRVWLETDERDWNAWVAHVRDRRNAVHAYRDRELGSFEEFEEDVRAYLQFVCHLSSRLPEPPNNSFHD